MTIEEVKSIAVLIVMGDFNAKIGGEKHHQSVAGSHGLGVRNERGTRLVHFLWRAQASNHEYIFPTTKETTLHLDKPCRHDKKSDRLYSH